MTVAAFNRPFAEQVAAFRLRLTNLTPTAKWDDVWQDGHDRAFMVAGATKADLLADLAAAVDKAVSQGTTLEEFRRDFREIVETRGWHGWTGEGTAKGEAWRTRIIYKTNMSTSYAAGRFAQLQAAGFKFWIYHHGNARDPRIEHLGWDGLVLPPDHPFWVSHYPPNGWGCTCYVSGARTEGLAKRRAGKQVDLPDDWNAISAKTGAPIGIDKGWAYAPGRTVAPQINAAMAKLPKLPAPIGAALGAALAPLVEPELKRQFADFLSKSLGSNPEQNYMVVGAIKREWIAAAAKHSVTINTAEIAVTDKNILHTFRGTPHVTMVSTKTSTGGRAPKERPLDLDWYRDLPGHLVTPDEVWLDQSKPEPVLILIYDIPPDHAKLVLEIGTYVKKASAVMNTVQSGRIVSANDLAAQLGSGAIQLASNKP